MAQYIRVIPEDGVEQRFAALQPFPQPDDTAAPFPPRGNTKARIASMRSAVAIAWTAGRGDTAFGRHAPLPIATCVSAHRGIGYSCPFYISPSWSSRLAVPPRSI